MKPDGTPFTFRLQVEPEVGLEASTRADVTGQEQSIGTGFTQSIDEPSLEERKHRQVEVCVREPNVPLHQSLQVRKELFRYWLTKRQ
jgi:hypothetical protein